MTIKNKITFLRNQNNWSMYRLSKEADIPLSTISSWYNTDVMPSLYSLVSISKAFSISMSELFEDFEIND